MELKNRLGLNPNRFKPDWPRRKSTGGTKTILDNHPNVIAGNSPSPSRADQYARHPERTPNRYLRNGRDIVASAIQRFLA